MKAFFYCVRSHVPQLYTTTYPRFDPSVALTTQWAFVFCAFKPLRLVNGIGNLCHHDRHDKFFACEVKDVLCVSSFNTEKEV